MDFEYVHQGSNKERNICIKSYVLLLGSFPGILLWLYLPINYLLSRGTKTVFCSFFSVLDGKDFRDEKVVNSQSVSLITYFHS